MEMGAIITEYRKSKGLTQEELANRLGVTAPTVNKWERGHSLPDIMLLAPLARALEISLDTLLAFESEMTTEEVDQRIREGDERFRQDAYEDAFGWCESQMNQYPNCDALIWQMAVLMDSWRLKKDIRQEQGIEKKIIDYYHRALLSKNEAIRSGAAQSLFDWYIREEDYEEAENYLAYFSTDSPERKYKQGLIYSKTGRMDEAYKEYEEIIFKGYQEIHKALNGIYVLNMKQGNREKGQYILGKQQVLAHDFEMGRYHEIANELDFVVEAKDVERTIDIMEEMLAELDTVADFSKSRIYEHMTFRDIRPEFLAQMKEDLIQAFTGPETYGYMKENKRWQALSKTDVDNNTYAED